jgi:hypothetical protein
VHYTFVETTAFTQRITKLGLEDDLRLLQSELIENPQKGDTERGTGGLRKVRMADATRGQGKSFGARVHYVFSEQARRFYLVLVYAKNEAAGLTAAQKKQLKAVVRLLVTEP